MGAITRLARWEARAPAWPAVHISAALLLAAVALPVVLAESCLSRSAWQGTRSCTAEVVSSSSLLQTVAKRASGTGVLGVDDAATGNAIAAAEPVAAGAAVATASTDHLQKVWEKLRAVAGEGATLPTLDYMTCGSRLMALASGAVALISEMSFAALGFGPAVMYEIFWQLFYVVGVGSGHLEEAVWNSLIMSSAVAVVQAFWLRKHLNLRVAVLMTVPLLLGLPIGTLILEQFGESHWIKKLLGTFFLVMVAMHGAGSTTEKPKIEDLSLKTSAWVVFAAFVGGLSRGLFGVSAPVSMLLLFFSLDRDLWRLINAIYRIVIFAVQGSILFGHLRPERHCAAMYASLVAGGMMGMVLGNMAAPKVRAADLQRWLTFFLASAGLLMLSDGHRELEIVAAFISVLTLVCMPVVAYVVERPAVVCKDADLGFSGVTSTVGK